MGTSTASTKKLHIQVQIQTTEELKAENKSLQHQMRNLQRRKEVFEREVMSIEHRLTRKAMFFQENIQRLRSGVEA